MNRNLGRATALVAAVFLALLAVSAAGPSQKGPASYEVSVTALPGSLKPDGIRFVARVSDLERKSVVAGADVTVGAGETASARSQDPPSEATVVFSATLAKDRKSCSYTLTVHHQGKLAAKYAAKMQLPLR